MKKTLAKGLALAFAGSLLVAGSAMAVPVSVTYTGDNIIDTWYIEGNGSTNNIAAGANRTNWQIADTATIDLPAGINFSMIWEVTNVGAASANNPGGFLGEIDFGAVEPYYSDVTWQYAIQNIGTDTTADFSTWNWLGVTSYARNDDTTSIWYTTLGTSIAGIDGQAEWIWSENNFNTLTDPRLFIRADVTPVPEPATMLLMGTGLAGLAGAARKRKKKA